MVFKHGPYPERKRPESSAGWTLQDYQASGIYRWNFDECEFVINPGLITRLDSCRHSYNSFSFTHLFGRHNITERITRIRRLHPKSEVSAFTRNMVKTEIEYSGMKVEEKCF